MVKPQKPRALWRIVLVVSLCLNLAFVGLLAGVAFSGKVGGGPPPRMSFGLGPITEALDRSDRRAIAGAVRGQIGLRPLLRQDLQTLIDTLRQSDFDPDALRSVLRAQSDRTNQVVTAAQDAFVDHVSQMSAAERAEFADRLNRKRRSKRSGN